MAGYSRLFLMSLLYLSFSVCTGHSISTSEKWPETYSNYSLWDICDSREHVMINFLKLSNPFYSALIVHLDFENNRKVNLNDDFECTFTVKAHKGDKISAVIQGTSSNNNQNTCSKIIQFNTFPGICENSGKSFGIFNLDGTIETTISLSKEYLLQRNERDLVIVYNSYRDCDGGNDLKQLNFLPLRNICMKKDFVCDGLQNCYGWCKDEENCVNIYSEFYVVPAGLILIGIFIIFLFYQVIKFFCQSTSTSIIEVLPREITHQNSLNISPSIATSYDAWKMCDSPPSYDSVVFERRI